MLGQQHRKREHWPLEQPMAHRNSNLSCHRHIDTQHYEISADFIYWNYYLNESKDYNLETSTF